MGKKVKIGKKRKDKFYHLAKETGYRARSAFKLIQLNRKFGFLQESRVLVDLCAAPGGWLQVATKFMPISSVILGIDLVAIKPIKNVTTFQADITTDHCRQLIKKELKTWKVDVVLNDGAPNVGSAWVQDAFSQAQLALSALKLASEHLRKGGWFITKVFRSKDYSALLWVFQQLFKKVHSTKPQASRSESAEIFVVCQGYLAPDKLDDKFLDPKHVFKEIQQDSKIRLNILKPEKQVRQREGYPENNITLHTTITDKEFIESSVPMDILSTANKINIVDEAIKNHKLTTNEIEECCNDIKVLGRSELKALFQWRKKIRKDLKLDNEKGDDTKVDENKGEVIENEEEDEEEEENEVDQMISALKREEAKDLKKKKKRVREQKKKLQVRLANKLSGASGDSGEFDQDLFALNLIKDKEDLKKVDANSEPVLEDPDEDVNEDDTDDNESEASDSEKEYIYGDDELYEKPSKRMKTDDNDDTKKHLKKVRFNGKTNNPLLVKESDIDGQDESTIAVNKAKEWFQKDVFKDIDEGLDDDDDLLDDDYDIEHFMKQKKKKKTEKEKTKDLKKFDEKKKKVEKVNDKDDEGIDSGCDQEESEEIDDETDDESDSGDDSEIDDRSIVQGKVKEINEKEKENKKKSGFDVVPQGYLSPEALALGTAMVTSKKRKRDIIDDSFNRYTFNDENLPSWFTEDESRHTARQIPVSREEVEFYKNRMREINARPIKKVIEAKAKKKSKMLKKLDRARKKAQGILDATDTSNQEKQDTIKGIYKRAGLLGKKKAETTYVVAKKGLAGKKYKRPANVKGSYKVVDPRMKKDLRAMKSKEKTKGRGKKKKGR